ncbi:MAG: hypothetical protein ABI413_16955 [Ktedonobacteraceae bacterium]
MSTASWKGILTHDDMAVSCDSNNVLITIYRHEDGITYEVDHHGDQPPRTHQSIDQVEALLLAYGIPADREWC